MAAIEIKVVDASAIVALLFAEPSAPLIAEQLRDCELIAPQLLDFELVNACLSKIRRQPEQREALLDAFAARTQMRIETIDIDHLAVLALAQHAKLTGYDASYLHLARTLGAELVTLDRQLAKAAEKDR